LPALSHPIKKRIPEASAVILLLLVTLAVWLGLRLLNETAWVRHTLEVETKISEIRASLLATEIGQRSFVLTGDETLLEPFWRGRERLGADLDELAQLFLDNPKQLLAVAGVSPLIEQRLAGADQAIELHRRGDLEHAKDQVFDKDEARAMRPGLKVLYMTGFTRNAIVHNGTLDIGVYLLAKPFTLVELAQKVREALNAVVVD
jgi:CHASE3 domain sensor protein